MSVKERVVHELNGLSEAELEEVVEYMAFLKFRARINATPPVDETQLAVLCVEFAEEDGELAEEGISEYAEGLMKEDSR